MSNPMNSRERVLAAAERRKTDRPPTSLRCTPEAWHTLCDYLHVETNDDALDALDVDLRWVPLPFIGPKERSAIPLGSEGTDFWGCHIRKAQNEFNTYFEFYDFPLAGAKTVDDVHSYDWPSLDWWDYSTIPAAIEKINRNGRRAIMFFAGGAFETPWYMRGLEAFFVDLYERPEIAAAICEHVEEYYRQRALRVIEAAGGCVDVIGSGGDIGGERGMLLSPRIWRERIKPYSGRLITTFKQLGLKTFYHSCGSIVPVINDFIELGLDILEPIQVSAAGMSPEEVSAGFADRLSFNGAIDVVRLLPHATAEEVYRETTRTIDILGRNGGYIVSPSHQVQGDTPAENIVAVFDAARNYRWK
jgi:uroporphyrinogen decarboxylase